ncbi:MAG: hypothetical protein B6U73_00550 [Desulfurococcales archaeon ex4484_204]|nr:MAG: hypothetical protein B6U73_00550 [Desulfurococcales archaeon ex4484_204]
MFLLRVEAEVRPTEDVSKVKRSILNVVGIDSKDLKVVETPSNELLVVGESRDIKSLARFHEVLRHDRILDAARKVMLASAKGSTLVIKLHKQSAYAGHVSFITYDDESPLGPITIAIVSGKLKDIIDWLAPKTSRGRPLWERGIPSV